MAENMTLEELVRINQGLGYEIDQLRQERRKLRDDIAARLSEDAIEAEAAQAGPGAAHAPGVTLVAHAKR